MVLWVLDFFIAEGIKGFYKCVLVLMRYLQQRFLQMSFDQIMNFLSDITRKELFTNIEYEKYLEDKAAQVPLDVLSNKYAGYISDFLFLDSFRAKVSGIVLTDALLDHLKNKYQRVSESLNKKL